MTTLGIIIISTIILILLIYAGCKIDKKHGDGKLQFLFEQTLHNIKEEWPTILILIIIVGSMLGIHYLLEEDHLFLHLSVEFGGVIILFLLVEHAVSKLDSGISDPRFLPIEKFIADVKKAKKEVIIFDTILETLLLDDVNYEAFRDAVATAYSNNTNLSLYVLLLSRKNPFEIPKSSQKLLDAEEYEDLMSSIHDRLFMIKNHVQKIKKVNTSKIIFREYETAPDFALYSVDGKAYISFYPAKRKNTDSTQLYVPNDTAFAIDTFGYFYQKFVLFWETDTKIIQQAE